MRGPRGLRTRLFLAIGAAVLLAVGISLLVGGALTRSAVRHQQLNNLSGQADLLALRAAGVPAIRDGRLRPRAEGPGPEGRRGLEVTFAPAATIAAELPPDARDDVLAGRPVNGSATLAGRKRLFAARPLEPGAALLLTRPARVAGADWEPFLRAFAIAALAGAALAAIVALLLARLVARPVRRVADATRRVAAGETPAAVPATGARELAELAEAFNDMAGQLERAREAQRSFLMSVSHELKTPLTAVRGYAEGLSEGAIAADEAGAVIGAEASRLERLVGDLLDLARLDEHRFAVRSERVDLAAAAEEVARRHGARARDAGVAMTVSPARPDATAVADGDRVVQVISNLVENALRVTPAGGGVEVTVGPGEVVVADSGPGIAPEDIPHAFERFHLHERLRSERPVGTGLGLAIVRQLTEAMGGHVEVTSEPGDGARFTVELPRVDTPASGV